MGFGVLTAGIFTDGGVTATGILSEEYPGVELEYGTGYLPSSVELCSAGPAQLKHKNDTTIIPVIVSIPVLEANVFHRCFFMIVLLVLIDNMIGEVCCSCSRDNKETHHTLI